MLNRVQCRLRRQRLRRLSALHSFAAPNSDSAALLCDHQQSAKPEANILMACPVEDAQLLFLPVAKIKCDPKADSEEQVSWDEQKLARNCFLVVHESCLRKLDAKSMRRAGNSKKHRLTGCYGRHCARRPQQPDSPVVDLLASACCHQSASARSGPAVDGGNQGGLVSRSWLNLMLPLSAFSSARTSCSLS